MRFWRTFVRNLMLMALVLGGMTLFVAIFYPETLSVFKMMGQVYSGLNLWPMIILLLVLAAVPRRR